MIACLIRLLVDYPDHSFHTSWWCYWHDATMLPRWQVMWHDCEDWWGITVMAGRLELQVGVRRDD